MQWTLIKIQHLSLKHLVSLTDHKYMVCDGEGVE